MKKIFKHLFVLSLVAWMLVGFNTNYYAAGASLSGPSTVRAGDTITLNLNLSDTIITGMQGELSYDASQLTLSSVSTGLSGWE